MSDRRTTPDKKTSTKQLGIRLPASLNDRLVAIVVNPTTSRALCADCMSLTNDDRAFTIAP